MQWRKNTEPPIFVKIRCRNSQAIRCLKRKCCGDSKQIATAKSQSEILKQQISSTLEQVKIQNRAILSEKILPRRKFYKIDEQLNIMLFLRPLKELYLPNT